MSSYIDNAQELADELGVSVAIVNRYADDLHLIAKDCLHKLDGNLRKKALWYLTAFVVQHSQKEVVSESVDDASRSFAVSQKDMAQNMYGRMALALAPCLGKIGVKQYTVRLLV